MSYVCLFVCFDVFLLANMKSPIILYIFFMIPDASPPPPFLGKQIKAVVKVTWVT